MKQSANHSTPPAPRIRVLRSRTGSTIATGLEQTPRWKRSDFSAESILLSAPIERISRKLFTRVNRFILGEADHRDITETGIRCLSLERVIHYEDVDYLVKVKLCETKLLRTMELTVSDDSGWLYCLRSFLESGRSFGDEIRDSRSEKLLSHLLGFIDSCQL